MKQYRCVSMSPIQPINSDKTYVFGDVIDQDEFEDLTNEEKLCFVEM